MLLAFTLGKYYAIDGSKYEGYWSDNKRSGKGTFYYADANKYRGEWKDDKRHGRGDLRSE